MPKDMMHADVSYSHSTHDRAWKPNASSNSWPPTSEQFVRCKEERVLRLMGMLPSKAWIVSSCLSKDPSRCRLTTRCGRGQCCSSGPAQSRARDVLTNADRHRGVKYQGGILHPSLSPYAPRNKTKGPGTGGWGARNSNEAHQRTMIQVFACRSL
jgi:hypothetical protein